MRQTWEEWKKKIILKERSRDRYEIYHLLCCRLPARYLTLTETVFLVIVKKTN